MFEVVENLRQTASADAAFGEPQEVEGRVLIPVAEVGIGFGLGFGQGTSSEGKEESDVPEGGGGGEGGGAGGGAKSRPVAVIEVTPEETVIKPIVDESKISLAGVLLVGWIVFWLTATVRAVFRYRS